MTPKKPPTLHECSNNLTVAVPGGQTAIACWFPQLGGYIGRCVMVHDGECVTLYVWHDGRFPFDGGRQPVELHACDGRQFISFGQLMVRFQDSREQDDT